MHYINRESSLVGNHQYIDIVIEIVYITCNFLSSEMKINSENIEILSVYIIIYRFLNKF